MTLFCCVDNDVGAKSLIISCFSIWFQFQAENVTMELSMLPYTRQQITMGDMT